jgi:pyruvate dehydrogenase E1 component alpha subunit
MITKEKILKLYRTIATIRRFELRCIELYRQGLIKGYFHPYLGEEAIAAGVCGALTDRDYVVSTHRGHGHCIARGADLSLMIAELLGRKTGYCQGLGGSMYLADAATGNLGANGIVGAGIARGVGAALASRLRNEDRVTAIFFSDGASNNGVFPESLNLAAVWNLPVVFVLENNHYASSTPIEKASRTVDLYKIGKGYSIESLSIDGNDMLTVYQEAVRAVRKCRKGKGPVLIECKTYRHGGHHVNDPGLYMPRDRVEHYRARDPLALGRAQALSSGTAAENELAAIDAEIESAIDRAIAFAQESPEMTLEEFTALTKGY